MNAINLDPASLYTPPAPAQLAVERRANKLATRRRAAAEAMQRVPGCDRFIRAVATGEGTGLTYDMAEARRYLRAAADTAEHGPAARVALDALGLLWAAL